MIGTLALASSLQGWLLGQAGLLVAHIIVHWGNAFDHAWFHIKPYWNCLHLSGRCNAKIFASSNTRGNLASYFRRA